MLRKTHPQNQPASSSTSLPALGSEALRRPGKERVTKLNEIDAVQMNNHQTQLEEAIGMTSQEIGSIKELLQRLFVPQAPTTTRGDNVVAERRAR